MTGAPPREAIHKSNNLSKSSSLRRSLRARVYKVKLRLNLKERKHERKKKLKCFQSNEAGGRGRVLEFSQISSD